MHLAQRARPGRKILGKGKNRPALHKTMTRNDTVRGNLKLLHAEIDTTVTDKHIDLPKGTRIE